ncbi:hypothetical protein BGZ46_006033 [Entomortierella lignicola]|nr:hypothetical protein BGZ46_006033 [Entomortierella lignicola]
MDFTRISQLPVRLYMLVSNTITLLMSIGLAAVGIFGFSNVSLVFLEWNSLSWFLVILSLLIFFTSAFGVASTLIEDKRMISTYGVMVSFLVITQLGFIIYTIVQHGKIGSMLDQTWQNSYNNSARKLKQIETSLSCCGFSSIEDRAIPKSSPDACRKSRAFGYQVPCQDQLKESYDIHSSATLTCVICIQALQLLALVSAIALWPQIPRDDEVEGQYLVEHSERVLRGLQEEDQEQRQQSNAGPSQGQERGYGSISTSN